MSDERAGKVMANVVYIIIFDFSFKTKWYLNIFLYGGYEGIYHVCRIML